MRLSTGSFARQEVSMLAGQVFENGSSVKTYARMFDLRGDGLNVTPEGEMNIKGVNPKNLSMVVLSSSIKIHLFVMISLTTRIHISSIHSLILTRCCWKM